MPKVNDEWEMAKMAKSGVSKNGERMTAVFRHWALGIRH
jgi:hypothetical protein